MPVLTGLAQKVNNDLDTGFKHCIPAEIQSWIYILNI